MTCRAKRLECVELAPAFATPPASRQRQQAGRTPYASRNPTAASWPWMTPSFPNCCVRTTTPIVPYVKEAPNAEDKNLLATVGSRQHTRNRALAPGRLALTAPWVLVRTASVTNICCQPGQMINSAGRRPVRGREAEWAYWAALPLHQLSQRNNRHRDTEKWSSLTLSLNQ